MLRYGRRERSPPYSTTAKTVAAHQPQHHAACCRWEQLQSAQMPSAQGHSPNHMVSSSGPLTEMKLAWHSLAIALASSVFPQPAGVSESVRASLQRQSKTELPPSPQGWQLQGWQI